MTDNIKEKHRRNRRTFYYLVAVAAVLAGSAALLAYYDMIGDAAFIVLFFASLAFGLWGNFKYWRCPSCNGHLGKLYFGLRHPKHCPECGIRLLEEE